MGSHNVVTLFDNVFTDERGQQRVLSSYPHNYWRRRPVTRAIVIATIVFVIVVIRNEKYSYNWLVMFVVV